jgi:hypothetical protein
LRRQGGRVPLFPAGNTREDRVGTIYVARSKGLQTWGADVGLGKNLYAIGYAEDGTPEEILAAGLAGEKDWVLVKAQGAEDTDEAALLERLGRKEKLVDPTYYPRIRGARGLVKVDPVKVENSMRIRKALETGQEPKEIKVKPADIAQYLINNALG